MSRYRTCREMGIKPKFSTPDNLCPYELQYVMTEWTGQWKRQYDRGHSWRRIQTSYYGAYLVLANQADDDTCYICRNWDAATELKQHLEKEI